MNLQFGAQLISKNLFMLLVSDSRKGELSHIKKA